MRSKLLFLLLFVSVIITSCKKKNIDTLGGSQSPIGEVGVTLATTASVNGVSSVSGSVTSLEDGISSFSGSAVITNTAIKNILSGFPGTSINGNNVTVSGIEFKITTEGIKSFNGLEEGIIVKYDAKVGDKYSISGGGKRTVISRSTIDDYPWGFMDIKVIQVEENVNKLGIKKINYWANHRFGLVGVEITFDDNSTANFPIFASAQNP